MNTEVGQPTRLNEDFNTNQEEYSSPKSKRRRLSDGSNNNLPSESKNSEQWSYNNDTSLVEPEVLVDLGVSILNEEVSNESLPKLPSQDFNKSPQRQSITQENFENIVQDDIKRSFTPSNFESINVNRLTGENSSGEKDPVFTPLVNKSGFVTQEETIDNFPIKNEDIKIDINTLNVTSDANDFCIFKRKKRPSFEGVDEFNKLSDEIILMIMKWLPKKCLVRSMMVCKRWCRIAKDEALWSRLDLGGKILMEGTLGHILPRGVQILRLAQTELTDEIFLPNSDIYNNEFVCKLQYLDLSMAVISPEGLAQLLSLCKQLKKLSLEKCTLNEDCCIAISQNPNINSLNLTMCEGIDVDGVRHIMKLKQINSLNVAWCIMNSESINLLCQLISPSVTRLNISGCRKTLTDTDVLNLIDTCTNLIELDLSDCTMLTINSVHCISNLRRLEHLALSRCYSIPPTTYLRLIYMPSLRYLDVFGLMAETMIKNLQRSSDTIEINKFLYSSVARPTVGVRRTSIWGLRVRD